MSTTINVKTLRYEMRWIIERVKRGEDFTVLYRSRPAHEASCQARDAYLREGGFMVSTD